MMLSWILFAIPFVIIGMVVGVIAFALLTMTRVWSLKVRVTASSTLFIITFLATAGFAYWAAHQLPEGAVILQPAPTK